MVNLTTATDSIQVALANARVTNHLQCVAFFRDMGAAFHTPNKAVVLTDGTTPVTLIAGPGTNAYRVIDYLSVYNSDTVNQTVIVSLVVSGVSYTLFRGVVGVGEKLEFNDKCGFSVMTIAGAIKQAQLLGASNVAVNTLNVVVLASDVVNNNAILNTIQNVTGLEFPVTAGETYWFEFVIPYTSAATTTGSRWSINGPGSPDLLNYRSEYTLAATTTTVNSATAYDIPAASNATSLTAGNVATIWGYIKPTSNGSVIARFASEIANSAITAKAGATVRYMRVL